MVGCEENPVQPQDDGSIVWQQTAGPYGIKYYWMLCLPTGIDYVTASAAGVYKTTNAGLSWVSSSDLPKSSPTRIMEDGSFVLFTFTDAGRSFSRSTNGGQTWTALSAPTASPLWPSMSASGVWFFAANQDGIYRSTNAGVSWTRSVAGLDIPTNPTSPYKIPISEVIQLDDSVCFANGSEMGLYRSTDLGTTWSPSSLGRRFVLEVLSLGPQVALVGTDKAIFRTTDQGVTWDSVSSKAGYSIARNAGSGKLFAMNGNGLSVSANNGLTWTHSSAPLAAGAISVNAVGTVYVGDSRFGLFRSTDDGATWSESNQGIVGSSVTEMAAVGNTILAYHNGGSRSTDLGATWSPVDVPIQGIGLFFHFAVSRGDTVYAGANGVIRSTDAGATWHKLPSSTSLGTIASVASDQTGQVFAGTYNGAVYRSGDGGASWSPTTSSTYVYPVHDIASNGKGIVVMSNAWNQLALSTNNGATWASIRTLPSEHLSVAVSPDGTLYVGDFDGRLFRSTDLGASWQTKLLSNSYGHNVASFSFAGSSIVLAASYGGGVYISRDNGQTWSEANNGLSNLEAPSVTATSSGYIFVGTDGTGVFRINSPVR